MIHPRFLVALSCLAALAACEGPATHAEYGIVRVRVGFVQREPLAARLDVRHGGGGPSFTAPAPPPVLRMSGPNGTLVMANLTLLASDVRLERVPGACRAGSADCVPMVAAVAGLDLTWDPVHARDAVPNGRYAGVRLRLEDLDADDEAEAESAQRVRALAADVRGRHGDWPAGATMRVSGIFHPTPYTGRPFTVYLSGEGEVVAGMDPMLDVEDMETSDVHVRADPEKWFREADGSVTDLSVVDGQVVELGERLPQGFIAHAGRAPD